MPIKEDMRVIKTKRSIEKAVLELLEEFTLKEITVQKIIDKAMINRGTFYRHYNDKFDVVETMCKKQLHKLEEIVSLNFTQPGSSSSRQETEKIYKELYAQKKAFLRLLQIKTDTIRIEDDIFKLLKNLFIEHFYANHSKEFELDYLGTIFAIKVIYSIKWHLENDKTDIDQHMLMMHNWFHLLELGFEL